jgi:hypothetical protein
MTFNRLGALYFIIILGALSTSCKHSAQSEVDGQHAAVREVWSEEQANEWYDQWGWLRGANFLPSSAINQLEMWQAETFDTVTIARELGWAEDIGMNRDVASRNI